MKTKQNGFNDAVRSLCRLYTLRVMLLYLISLLTAWNFLAGFFILVLRQMRFFSIDFVGFGLVGVPVMFLLSSLLAHRHPLEREKALALVDSCNRAGGLALAASETSDNSWIEALPQHPHIPAVRARLNRRLPALLVSFVFLLASLSVPLYSFSSAKDRKMDLQSHQEKAQMQIETLEETGLIDEAEAAELKNTLENMVKSAESNDPAKTFEAFDQLKEKIAKEGAAAVQKAASAIEELEKLKEKGEALQKGKETGADEFKAAANELKNSFKSSPSASGMSSQQRESIQKGLEKVNQDGTPDAEAINQAAKELNEYIEEKIREKRQMAQKLRQAMIIDQKTFDQLKKEGKIQPIKDLQEINQAEENLIMAPAEESGQNSAGKTGKSGESGKAAGEGNNGQGEGDGAEVGESGQSGQDGQGGQDGMGTGSGGVSRGGGSAPLLFNRLSSQHKIRFKDHKLPDPGAASLEDSVTIGMGISAPSVDGETARHTGIAAQKPARSSGKSEIILPRHRSAVKSFFERRKH